MIHYHAISLNGWVAISTIAGGFITALAMFERARRAVWDGLKWARSKVDPFAKVIEVVEASAKKTDTRLARIETQVFPNSGGSLFDMVRAIEKRQALNYATAMAAFRAQDVLAWIADATGNMMEATDALVRLSGRPVEQLMGRNWEATIHPQDRKRVVDGYLDCILNGRIYEDHCVFMAVAGRNELIAVSARIRAEPTKVKGQVETYVGRIFPDESREEILEKFEAAERREALYERQLRPRVRRRKPHDTTIT